MLVCNLKFNYIAMKKTFILILVAILLTQNNSFASYDGDSKNSARPKFKIDHILNVSFDPTRKLYKEINEAFSKKHLKATNEKLYIKMSHGGSGKQARSIIDGLAGEVVTLAVPSDVDMLAKTGYVKEKWREEFPNNASPYSSIIIFLVRKGNPKKITDWADLIRPDVKVVTPNPKTSGGARWNYLAAWAWAKDKLPDEETAQSFITQLFKNVPILDASSRNSTITFSRREIGDVLISWESEAYLAIEEMGNDKFDIVYPSVSIKTELPIAINEKVVNRKKTRQIAKEYLNFLYSKEGQEIIAQNYYRPIDKKVMSKYSADFPQTKIIEVESLGVWEDLNYLHFSNKGLFDKIYRK